MFFPCKSFTILINVISSSNPRACVYSEESLKSACRGTDRIIRRHCSYGYLKNRSLFSKWLHSGDMRLGEFPGAELSLQACVSPCLFEVKLDDGIDKKNIYTFIHTFVPKGSLNYFALKRNAVSVRSF